MIRQSPRRPKACSTTTPHQPTVFVRNNGQIPPWSKGNLDAWTLTIDGDVRAPLMLTLGELKTRFGTVTRHMILECGRQWPRVLRARRARQPIWTNGGAGCAAWTGRATRRCAGVAGLTPAARYTAHYGADLPVGGDASPALLRGVRIEKALEPHSMLVWAMNGVLLPNIHGGPLLMDFSRLAGIGLAEMAHPSHHPRLRARRPRHDGLPTGCRFGRHPRRRSPIRRTSAFWN